MKGRIAGASEAHAYFGRGGSSVVPFQSQRKWPHEGDHKLVNACKSLDGTAGGIRTTDLLIHSQAL
jgi:hypothetical protein